MTQKPRGRGKVRCQECGHVFPHFKVWCGHADHYGHEGWEDENPPTPTEEPAADPAEVHIFRADELARVRSRWASDTQAQ